MENEARAQKRVFLVSRCRWMIGLHQYLLENAAEISLYSVKRPATLFSQDLTHNDVVVLHADRESDQIADLLESIFRNMQTIADLRLFVFSVSMVDFCSCNPFWSFLFPISVN